MNRILACLIACALAAVPAANAAPPPSAPAYPASQQGSTINFVAGMLSMWFDTTVTAIAGGAARPASTEYLFPVAVIAGPGTPNNPSSVTLDGTPGTGIAQPTGGAGSMGWLSGAYQQLVAVVAKLNGTVTVAPASATLTNCKNGTGSNIVSVGTSATGVCAAGTARSYWRIANMAGQGSPYVYCTDDGSTPSATNWTFVAYPQGFQDTAGMQVISPAALSCIASVATTITALAVQTGAAP